MLAFQDEILMEIINQYKSDGRYYHNLDHIAECLVVLGSVRHLAEDPDAVALAIWFHDVVYDVYSSENEFNSAQVAHANILKMGLSKTLADKVRRLIMATTHREMCSDNDERLVVDVDLVSLGAAPEIFQRNTVNIRKEFHNLSDQEYDVSREKMFQTFLERPSIYQTVEFPRKT